MIVCTLITKYNQHDGLLDKILRLSAERSGVRIPGREPYAVDARVNYPLYLFTKYKMEGNIFGDPITYGKFEMARSNDFA